jgi:hypothetical protein
MPNTTNFNASDTTSTTTLHRPFGGITGYRKVTDRASRVCVHAFPIGMVQQLSAAGLLSTHGAYALTDNLTGYIGESKRPGRRVAEHAADPLKKFARDVFVIAGCDGLPFDKAQVVDLQYRLTNLAVDAGMVTVMKGANPQESDLPEDERATQDRIFDDAQRLLYDAGCRIFHSNCDGAVAEHNEPEPPPADEATDIADAGPIQIGVTTTPLGAEEFELVYGAVWARGYWSGGHFIVAAGSEVRNQTNDSVNAITRSRRDELLNAGVLSRIPGIEDRRRLVAAVAFPSMSIAAKVVSGAHTTNRWMPLARSRALVLAA